MNDTRRFAALGGDARQTLAVRALRRAGFSVGTFGVPDCPDAASSPEELLARAECVLLPMPAFAGEYITGGGIPSARILAGLRPGTAVFGGKLGHRLDGCGGVSAFDYGADEILAAANAVPTAEGAVQIALEQLPVTLQGSRCLVIGFGRIGKLLCRKLAALGADVTAAARSEKDLALIAALGLRADRTGCYERPLGAYDAVFNTVPAPVLDEAQLAALPPGCLLVELASAPGGADPAACRALGVDLVTARGLPGRAAPKTAGELVCAAVLRGLEAL